MTDSSDKQKAIVVLPAGGNGRISSRALCRWLARGDVERVPESRSMLQRLLDELHADMPSGGLAAMRMWGQTGDRPSSWIAAADPVHLQPELDQLRLYALAEGDLPVPDVRRLVDHLQATLGGEGGTGFARIGRHCYLTSDTPLATSTHTPQQVDQRVPADFMPGGVERAGHRRLLSEIEMALHEHPVNAEREREARPVINSLWIWGGGYAPEPVDGELPPLFANDPLLRGYWRMQRSTDADWPGSIGRCLETGAGTVVAVVPDGRLLEPSLHELRSLLGARRVDELVMLFEDDLRATMTRLQALRFWRRDNALLQAGEPR